MSNYTKSTNFATKDNLSPGNPLKIVKGTEIDTEFNNIQTAVATKTDNASAAITGGSITGITDLAVADGGTGASTATAALNNLLPTQTGNANKYLQTDGTNATWDAVSLSTSDITGTLPVLNGGTGVTTSTGTGAVVLSNSPTLVTPALGTPASGTATNLTGLPISTGVSGLGSGVATFLGTPSSANLASAVTDETGSGALVFANSPTLVTPALGTPSALVGTNITGTASGLTAGNVTTNANLTGDVTSVGNATTLTNAPVIAKVLTGYVSGAGTVSATDSILQAIQKLNGNDATNANLTGMVTSVGNATTVVTNANLTGAVTSSGNATSLGSFSSANLLAALTDETGTGSAVFATSPTLVTPILGTPTSATLTNATGLPLTTGVTGTLPVANGGTGTATPSIVAGTNVTVTGTWPNQTIASTAGGTGDVVGPASSTDNAFVRFDSTTGKLLQNSTGATLSDTGAAVFTGALDVLGNSTAGSNIKLYEDTDNGTNYVAFKAPDTIAADVTWTLPAADGTSAQVLSTNGSGTLSWATAGGGSAATPTALGTVYGATTGNASPYNALIGYNAGVGMTSGVSNTAIGWEALKANTSASNNTAVGYKAGFANTTGTANVYMGYNAGRANTTGNYNIGIGQEALDANTGDSNIGIGYYAVGSNTTGSSNTGIGREALSSSTTGIDNVGVGHQALTTNSTGQGNTAVGRSALKSNSSGQQNTAVGFEAGFSLTSSNGYTFVGYQAGKNTTTNGNANAFGAGALLNNTTGFSITAIGDGSLGANTTGYQNNALGTNSLQAVTTGLRNIGIGSSAGSTLTTGSDNLYIGQGSTVSAVTVSGETVIGTGVVGKGANTAFIHANGGGAYQGNNTTTWSTTSDRRLKKNIVDNNTGLEKLTQIQVRNFEYRLPEEVIDLPQDQAIKKSGVQLGVIAQELQAVLPECVKTESTGVMTVDADNLTWYLINAVKELSARVKQLEGN